MDKAILRQAALDLYSLDNELHGKDVVKVASTFKRIVNWFKGLSDPEYKENVNKLKEQSPQVKFLIDNVKAELNRLDKAISDGNPEQYGQALEALRPLLSELSSSLSSLDASATEAIANAPTKAVVDEEGNVYSENEFIQYVEGDYRKNPKIMEQLKKQLPSELDVPIKRRLLQPLKSYEWFKQFNKDDIYISRTVAENIKNTVKDALVTGAYALNVYEADQAVDANFAGLLSNLQDAVLNGTLLHYTYPPVGGRGGKRTANQMQLVVNAGIVNIPNTDLYIEFPTVLLTDKYASVDAIKKLDLFSVKNVRFVRTPDPTVQKDDVPDLQTDEEPETLDIPVDFDPTVVSEKTSNRINEMLKLAKSSNFLQNFNANFQKSQGRPPNKKEITIARDRWARNILIEAFRREMGRDPIEAEIQAAQAVAKLESHYGAGWKGAGVGSNNWGAIQCCKPKDGKCPPNSFLYTDTSPTSDGKNVKYSICFKSYATPVDGAADLIRTLYKSKYKDRGQKLIAAVSSGDLYGFSEAMYDTSYYQGHGKTREERIANHANLMKKLVNNINESTGLKAALVDKRDFNGKLPTQSNKTDEQYSVLEQIKELIKSLFANANNNNIIKTAVYDSKLPKTRVLIRVGSNNLSLPVRVRFAKILSTALRIEIEADASIHNYKNNVEVECDIYGSEKNVLSAVRGVCEAVSEAFEESTNKYKVATTIFPNVKSSYALVSSDFMESCFRKFAFEAIINEVSPRSDLTYSSAMRKIRKDHKDSVKEFQLVFKKAFEKALDDEVDDPEQVALIEALEMIGVEI